MTHLLITNPNTPEPIPLRFEMIRRAALELWGEASISQDKILKWVRDGCPDAEGGLLNAATHQPPIPAQGQIDPGEFMARLLKQGVFLRV